MESTRLSLLLSLGTGSAQERERGWQREPVHPSFSRRITCQATRNINSEMIAPAWAASAGNCREVMQLAAWKKRRSLTLGNDGKFTVTKLFSDCVDFPFRTIPMKFTAVFGLFLDCFEIFKSSVQRWVYCYAASKHKESHPLTAEIRGHRKFENQHSTDEVMSHA